MQSHSHISAEAEPAAATTALRAYRGLMFLYPKEFRGEYARELCLAFDDRCRAARSAFQIFAIWIHSAVGVFTDAPKEHIHVIIQDLRHALRLMRKDLVVTLTAIAILALGIGSTTIVFSLANGLLVRPLPYPHTDRIVYIEETNTSPGAFADSIAFPNYLDMRARTRLLDDIALYNERLATIRGEGLSAERVPAADVSDGLFRVLGVAPLLGRTFTREEDLPNGPKVVVIGEDLWRRRFGADPNIVGRVINMVSTHTQIIGVMPSSFCFPNRAVAWLPLQLSPKDSTRTSHYLLGIARLKSGVSIEQADAELQSLMEQINRENPVTSYGNSAHALPIREVLARQLSPRSHHSSRSRRLPSPHRLRQHHQSLARQSHSPRARNGRPHRPRSHSHAPHPPANHRKYFARRNRRRRGTRPHLRGTFCATPPDPHRSPHLDEFLHRPPRPNLCHRYLALHQHIFRNRSSLRNFSRRTQAMLSAILLAAALPAADAASFATLSSSAKSLSPSFFSPEPA